MNQSPQPQYEFGPFRFDTRERLLARDGESVSLTPKAFDLLLALVERHGHLVEKEELFQVVWPDTMVEESNLSSNIALIRKALNDGENGLKFIETVPKRGYRFVAEVHAVQADVEVQQLSEEAATLVDETIVPVVNTAPAVEVRLTKRSGWRDHIAWVIAGVAVLAALALGVAYVRRPMLETAPMRLSITPPEKATSFDWPTISPDGRTLAFIAAEGGKTQLWVRPLNATTAKSLGDANHGNAGAPPFWSPDSRFLAFVSDGKLKKIALAGGAAEPLCDVSDFRGGTWNQEGVILFGESNREIKRVSANGGAATTVIKIDTAQRLRGPVFLPDGRHFVYQRSPYQSAKGGTWLASLEDGESRHLLDSGGVTIGVVSDPIAPHEGQLVFIQQGGLSAQAFDFRRNQVAGEPVRIAASVATNTTGNAKFSVARNGTLALLESRGDAQFSWVDRTGKRLETVGQPGRWLGFKVSPDAQRLMAERLEGSSQNADLRLLDLARGTDTRFTFDPAHNNRPIWSPDGSRIAWASNREGEQNLYQKATSGAGQDELLLRSAYQKIAQDWSADGRFLLYQEINSQTNGDLWVLPLEGERKPWVWLNTPFSENVGQFAPDGKWIAYQSNESGRNEVYVQAFVPGAPASGVKWQLSTKGGTNPTWRRDGRELYFISAAENNLMAVEVTLGAEVKAGTPRELFSLRTLRAGSINSGLSMTGDGQRFLFRADETTGLPPFTVVLNWMAEIKK